MPTEKPPSDPQWYLLDDPNYQVSEFQWQPRKPFPVEWAESHIESMPKLVAKTTVPGLFASWVLKVVRFLRERH